MSMLSKTLSIFSSQHVMRYLLRGNESSYKAESCGTYFHMEQIQLVQVRAVWWIGAARSKKSSQRKRRLLLSGESAGSWRSVTKDQIEIYEIHIDRITTHQGLKPIYSYPEWVASIRKKTIAIRCQLEKAGLQGGIQSDVWGIHSPVFIQIYLLNLKAFVKGRTKHCFTEPVKGVPRVKLVAG